MAKKFLEVKDIRRAAAELNDSDLDAVISQMSDEELKFALWGDCTDVSDDDLDDVRRYAAFVRERKKDRK